MPYTAESMCEVIDRVFAGTDVVIAVRNRSYHSRLSPMRKMMSYGSKLLNRIFLNIRHTDTQGGLKGLSPRARAVMLRTRISDFLFDTDFGPDAPETEFYSLKWKRIGDDGKQESGIEKIPKGGTAVVTTRLNQPGFVQLQALLLNDKGKLVKRKNAEKDSVVR